MSDERPPQNWFNSQIERRLDALSNSLDALWKETREEIRRGDGQANSQRFLERQVEDMRKDIDAIKKQLAETVLTKDDFRPYKNGLVMVISTVGVAVLGAVLKLVISQ